MNVILDPLKPFLIRCDPTTAPCDNLILFGHRDGMVVIAGSAFPIGANLVATSWHGVKYLIEELGGDAISFEYDGAMRMKQIGSENLHFTIEVCVVRK